MSAFSDISIGWDGKDYVIEGRQRFRVICLVEEEVTIGEIAGMAMDPARLKATSVAKGFCAILRFLGVTEVQGGKTVPITAETVFVRMFGEGADGDGPLVAVTILLALIQPHLPEPTAVRPNRAARRKSASKAGRVDGNR